MAKALQHDQDLTQRSTIGRRRHRHSRPWATTKWIESNTWYPRLTATMLLFGSASQVKGLGSSLASGPLLRASRRIFPFIERVFADSGYAGEKVAKATLIAVEIVRKNPDQISFAVQPRRWVVERFFAWIGRNRRLAKDFEATIDSARAFLYAASVMLLVRRIARAS